MTTATPAEPLKVVKGKKVTDTGLTVGFEQITPEVAKEMLEANHANRPVRDARVAAIVRDIESDRWQPTHQGVGFDTSGKLVDGQHRLWAVVRANKAVTMMVTRGLQGDVQEVIDTGAKRTVADVLHWAGITNRMTLAAVIKMHLHYTLGHTIGQYATAMSTPEQMEHFEGNSENFQTAARLAAAWHKTLLTPSQVLGTAWMIFNEIDPEDCAKFFEGIVNMTTDGPGDPRVALMARLRSRVEKNERLRASELLNMWVKAWNGWRTGTPVTKIQVDRLKTKKVLEAV